MSFANYEPDFAELQANFSVASRTHMTVVVYLMVAKVVHRQVLGSVSSQNIAKGGKDLRRTLLEDGPEGQGQ